jgi:hypothetical protein
LEVRKMEIDVTKTISTKIKEAFDIKFLEG